MRKIDAQKNSLMKMKKAPLPKELNDMTFARAAGPVMAVAQFFSQMPVTNITSSDPSDYQFRWLAVRSIYALTYITLEGIEVLLTVHRAFTVGVSIRYSEILMFHFFSWTQTMIFLKLATKWKDIMVYWRKKEKVFLEHPYKPAGLNLSIKFWTIALISFIFYLSEHISYVVMNLVDNQFQLENCNATYRNFYENFLRRVKPHLVKNIPYRAWQLPIYEWVQLQSVFCWNYTDIFLVMICIGLHSILQRFNERVKRACGTRVDDLFWSEIRVHYVHICDLVQFVDSHISDLILFSVTHNLLLVCISIFKSFVSEEKTPLSSFVYWYHLSFLMTRISLFLYYSTMVNEASKECLKFLRLVPTDQYNIDFRRLTDLMSNECIALSGRRFFFMTRQLILAMVGSIITYEIVILDKAENVGTNPCNFNT